MTDWRKSSYSGSGGAGGQDCVELGRFPQHIGLRDSKAPESGHLTLSAVTFAGLLDHVRRR